MRLRTIDTRPAAGLHRFLTEGARDPDWRPSGYRYRIPRDPTCDPDALKRALAIAYAEHRRQAHVDASGVVSVRRWRLRLMGRIA